MSNDSKKKPMKKQAPGVEVPHKQASLEQCNAFSRHVHVDVPLELRRHARRNPRVVRNTNT